MALCNVSDGLTRTIAEKVIEILNIEYEEDMKNNIINIDKMPHSNYSCYLDAVIYEDGRTNRRDFRKNRHKSHVFSSLSNNSISKEPSL